VSFQYRDHGEVMAYYEAYGRGGRYRNPATKSWHDRKRAEF